MVHNWEAWCWSSHAHVKVIMDGAADGGRFASEHHRLSPNVAMTFTKPGESADDVIIGSCRGTFSSVVRSPPSHHLERVLEDHSGTHAWLQLVVRLVLREAVVKRREGVSALFEDWGRRRKHVYTWSTRSEADMQAFSRVSQVLAENVDLVTAEKVSMSSMLVVTDDKALRSACQESGALLLSSRDLQLLSTRSALRDSQRKRRLCHGDLQSETAPSH